MPALAPWFRCEISWSFGPVGAGPVVTRVAESVFTAADSRARDRGA